MKSPSCAGKQLCPLSSRCSALKLFWRLRELWFTTHLTSVSCVLWLLDRRSQVAASLLQHGQSGVLAAPLAGTNDYHCSTFFEA